MMRRLNLWAGVLILAVLVGGAVLAPFLPLAGPFDQRLEERLAPPGPGGWLGRDSKGRDLLSRVVHGAQISLAVGLVTVGISAAAGLLIGALSGYLGGIVDEALMRLTDIFLAFPGILLAFALMAILGPGLQNVILALCVMGWVGYARLVRAQVLALKEEDYIAAARSLGGGTLRVIVRHLLPNVLAPVLVEATFGVASAILAEAGLSFLGLGTQPPTPSWGTILKEGHLRLFEAPHLSFFPGLAIMLTVLGFNLFGDGLRDILDPGMRAAKRSGGR
ncbi:MAG: ABC transporter permease [Nitrospinota bacterium]